MGIFSWKEHKGKMILVFDIRSSSVGGAIFYVDKKGIPEIIKTIREPILLQKSLAVGKFLDMTLKSLNVVVENIFKAGFGKPSEIFCVLSSPWHVSQTRVIKLEKNVPFIFTSKMADELIQKEVSLIQQEYETKYINTKNAVQSIEFKNIKTMLNGYEVNDPYNNKAKELEMTIFVSVSPEDMIKRTEETVAKYFHFKKITFCSFSLASFAVVRDIYSHNENFILIEIGGEITDILMVKKNVLRESASFPLGANFIIRSVASTLGSSLDEAKSFINLLQSGHAVETTAEQVKPILDKLKTEWLRQFQESLANISNDISIPSTIYLTVDKDAVELFSEIIKNDQFNQYTLSESKFVVNYLGAEIFHGMTTFGENVVRDPGLIIDSVYINRFLIDSPKKERI